MFVKLDTHEERNNKFFNEMMKDLNPKIYKIRTDRFVFVDKQIKLYGKVDIPNAHISIYINGALSYETDALGDGGFEKNIRLFDNENEILVTYE